MVAIIPSPPPWGTSTSAVILYDRPRMLGALLELMPGFTPVYVNTFRPAVALGRGASDRANDLLSNGSTWYLAASLTKSACISLSLAGILAARSLAWE